MFIPIKQTRVVVEVCKQITERILLGELKPGARLPSEREMAMQFAVSRSTIRESMRKLEQAGLVSIKTGASGGAFVANSGTEPVTNALSLMLQMEQVSAQDLLEARRYIESATVRLAAQRATATDLERIRDTLSDEANLSTKEGFIERNTEFHEAIARAAHNKVLLMSLRAIRDLISQSIENLAIDSEMMTKSLEFHRKIYEAVANGNSNVADETMLQHIDTFEKKLSTELDPRGAERQLD